jgi:uncharacterized protein
LIGISTPCGAALVHRYDFTTNADDSVGSAHGTLVGGASISGGALVTNGGNGSVNGTWSGSGPRVTLSASAVAGITGSFTIETWFTCTTGWPKFDTLYAFSDATVDNYLLASPVRGNAPWPSGVAVRGAGGVGDGNWDQVVSGIYLDTPGIHQAVLTYDGTSFRYYVDGVAAEYDVLPSVVVNPGFNLSTLTSIGINGGSPWNDPSLTGSTYDFRIYTSALSASQVASIYSLGSDATNESINALVIPEPGCLAISTLCLTGLVFRRRRAE